MGAQMKFVAGEIEKFDNSDIEKVLAGNFMLGGNSAKDEGNITINPEDIEVITDEIPGYEIASKGLLTVALDITITDKLQKEGNAREFVNRIQNIRKESGFALTDRVRLTVTENASLSPSLIEYKSYICAEILADSVEFVSDLPQGMQIEVNDAILKVNVLKNQ